MFSSLLKYCIATAVIGPRLLSYGAILHTNYAMSLTFPLKSCSAIAMIGPRHPDGHFDVDFTMPFPVDKVFTGIADKDINYTLPQQTVDGKVYYVGEFPEDGSYQFYAHQYPHTEGGQVVVHLANEKFIAAAFKGDHGVDGMEGTGEWTTVHNGDSIQSVPSGVAARDAEAGDYVNPHVPVMIEITREKIPGGPQEVIVSPVIGSPFDKEFKGTFQGFPPIPEQTIVGGLYYAMELPSDGDSYFTVQQYEGDRASELGQLVVEFYTELHRNCHVRPRRWKSYRRLVVGQRFRLKSALNSFML